MAKLFTLTRFTSPGDTPISRWQFQRGYPTYGATIGVTRQHVLVLGVQLTASGGINTLRPLPASMGGKAAVSTGLASFLRGYQRDGGFTPGPLLAFAALAGLIGSASLARRRTRPAAGQAAAALACFLFWTTAVAVLVISDLFEFSWRYQLPALITLPPAGALGVAVILSGIRRRRGAGPAGGERGQVPQLAAPAR